MPVVALIGAMGLLVAAGLAKTLLPLVTQTLVLAVIAAVALLRLRRALHLGLLQESREAAVEGDLRCPNCGLVTPSTPSAAIAASPARTADQPPTHDAGRWPAVPKPES